MSAWRVRCAWHESAHAVVAVRLGRHVESVSLDPATGAGVTKAEPLPPDASPGEIERALVVALAGREGERWVPELPSRASENGRDDPYFSGLELTAMVAVEESAERPTDEAAIEHYRQKIGDEAIERARALSAELVERAAVVGQLEAVADALLLNAHLDARDLEAILDAPARA